MSKGDTPCVPRALVNFQRLRSSEGFCFISQMIISNYIIPVLSMAGFFAHTLSNWLQDFGSGLTEVETVNKKLTDVPFPVLFQLSVIPAFRTDRLEQLGYGQAIFYFSGENVVSKSFVGWNEPNKTVSETFHSLVTMKNLNEIIPEIWIINSINDSDTVVVPVDIPVQPFFANNRFVLDISDYIPKDFKILWISFKIDKIPEILGNSTLQIEIHDKASFTTRYLSSPNILNAEQKMTFPLTGDSFEYVYQIELR